MPKVKETRLRKGDTIKCADAEDCVRTMNELAVCGISDTVACNFFRLDCAKDSEVEKMKKFNWKEFKNKDNKIAVHCKTEEEAKDFCKRMHEHGMKWSNGKSYLKNTNYMRNEGTCYYGNGEYSTRDFAEKYNYKILEWSDYMDKEFTKADLRDGMVVEQRNGEMYLVLAEEVVRKCGYNRIDGYTDDLKCEGRTGYTGGDIVKVYRITPESLRRIEDVFIKSNLELIWERKEPKKMTVEEMRQKLEELTGEEIEVTA